MRDLRPRPPQCVPQPAVLVRLAVVVVARRPVDHEAEDEREGAVHQEGGQGNGAEAPAEAVAIEAAARRWGDVHGCDEGGRFCGRHFGRTISVPGARRRFGFDVSGE